MNIDFAQILPFAVLGFVTFLAWFAFNFFSKQESRANERLEELRDPRLRERDRSSKQGTMESMLEKAAPKLSVALQPKSELEQSVLKVRLAGKAKELEMNAWSSYMRAMISSNEFLFVE